MNQDMDLIVELTRTYCRFHDIGPEKRLLKLELYVEPSNPFELELLEYLKKRKVHNVETFITWYLAYLSQAPLGDDWLRAMFAIHRRLTTL